MMAKAENYFSLMTQQYLPLKKETVELAHKFSVAVSGLYARETHGPRPQAEAITSYRRQTVF